MAIDLRESAALRALHQALPGGLRPGEVGWLVASAGAGKSSLLVHVGVERVLRGDSVFHVALRETVANVRDAYESVVGTLGRTVDRSAAQLLVERHRLIHCSRGDAVSTARLGELLDTLSDVMDAHPTLVLVDGQPPAAGFRELAQARGVAMWVAFTATAELPVDDADVVLELVPERGQTALHVRKGPGSGVVRIGGMVGRDGPQAAEGPITPAAVTLYSGGAPGAEAVFGECAEKWGLREVNFTFDGHVQARTRGAHPLTELELAAGDVSLAYVSRRLRRSWSAHAPIKRVLQSLWHMVSAAQQVFVVGAIQEDGTVTGGTGWSVELARMWSKRLWVFDQDKNSWYRWNGDDWFPGEPIIDSTTICGTGTRYLADNGRAAIEELFARTFAPAAA